MWCSGTKTPSNPASSAACAASRVSCQRRPMFSAFGGSCGRNSRPNFIAPPRSERTVEVEDDRAEPPLPAVQDHLGVVDPRALGHRLPPVGDDQAEIRG